MLSECVELGPWRSQLSALPRVPGWAYDFIAHGLPKSQQLARVDFGYLAFGKVEFFGLLFFSSGISGRSAAGPFLAFGAHERVSAA